jgi:Fur family ferric uptake transcriptional regulator
MSSVDKGYIMNNENYIKSLLAESGHKKTRSREAVFEVLAASDRPISARDIWEKLNQGPHSVNLSTVYRTLELFMDKKILEKTLLSDGTAKYHIRSSKHKHHLICTSCNRMVELKKCPLEKICQNVEDSTDFDITGHRLEFYGLCPNCKK